MRSSPSRNSRRCDGKETQHGADGRVGEREEAPPAKRRKQNSTDQAPVQATATGLLFAPSGEKGGIGRHCVSPRESAVREAQRGFCDDVVVGVVIEGGGALEGILRGAALASDHGSILFGGPPKRPTTECSATQIEYSLSKRQICFAIKAEVKQVGFFYFANA